MIESVRLWNGAILSRQREALEQVYAESVIKCSKQLSRTQVVTAKLAALAKAPDYSQTLDDLRIERRDTDHPEVFFEKRWLAAGEPGKVKGRLVLRREPSRWVVSEETDDWPHPLRGNSGNNGKYRVALAWLRVDITALTVEEQAIASEGSSGPLRTQERARDAVQANCTNGRRERIGHA